MNREPPRATRSRASAASDVYKRQVFALRRTSPDDSSRVICLHNVANRELAVRLSMPAGETAGAWRDLLSGEVVPFAQDGPALTLPPYGVRWLRPLPDGTPWPPGEPAAGSPL